MFAYLMAVIIDLCVNNAYVNTGKIIIMITTFSISLRLKILLNIIWTKSYPRSNRGLNLKIEI